MSPQSQPQANTQARTRTVRAPLPTDPSIPPSIFSIEVSEEVEVEWQWLELPDGNRVAIDYCIIERSFESSPDLPSI